MPPPPVALFPYRLETRFLDNARRLAIRIFPDDATVAGHERGLSALERQWVTELATAFKGDEAARRAAWGRLVTRAGTGRAAWIARAAGVARPAVEVTPRGPTWTDVPRARLLPERWVAYGFGPDDALLLGPVQGNPVTADLRLGASPEEAAGLRWIVDLAEAVRVGMAIVVDPLPEAARGGISRLVVVGLRPGDARTDLVELLDAHRHTRGGLGFLAEGTPTNNTPGVAAEHSSAEPDADATYPIVFASQLGEKSAGALAAEALGVDLATFAHLPGAGAGAGLDAARGHMNRALWEATWGYYLAQLAGAPLEPAAISAGRAHFAAHVRATGGLPVLRVDDQPYGLLAATPLASWTALFPGDLPGLVGFLRDIAPAWRASVEKAPRVGATADPQLDLLTVLATSPVSRWLKARHVLGGDYVSALYRFMLDELDDTWWQQQEHEVRRTFDMLGGPWRDRRPRVARTVPARDPFPWDGPLVDARPGAQQSAPAYLGALANRGVTGHRALRDEAFPEIAVLEPPLPMLHLLLRHTLLLEYVAAACAMTGRPVPAEEELVELDPARFAEPGRARPLTPWDVLDTPHNPADPTASGTLGEFLDAHPDQRLTDVRDCISKLAARPPAVLERLLCETLDLCSSRYDAWIESIATKRLGDLRGAGVDGLLAGGYGWVEDLRPAGAPASRGFVQAPSVTHATTAAMLASGYLAHRENGSGEALAIDLSSERVGDAAWLLDGVRQGRTPASQLGSRFERELHERGAAAMVAPFRRAFPPSVTRVPEAGRAERTVAATEDRTVVDGLAVQRAWAASKQDDGVFGTGSWPAVDPALRPAVRAALARLMDAVDGLSDTLLAESVHQIAQGNPAGAGATLDAIAAGRGLPDELAVAATPVSGSAITHRLLVLLRPPAAPSPGAPLTPRREVEPALDDWAGQLLGDPAKIVARVEYLKAGTSPPVVLASVTVSLAQLRPHVHPLDLVYAVESGEGEPELVRRLRHHALTMPRPQGVPADARVRLFTSRITSDSVSFREAMEIARAARALFAAARAGRPADLATPGTATARPVDVADLTRRAETGVKRLEETRAALQQALTPPAAAALRTALFRAAGLGVPDAIPGSSLGSGAAESTALTAQARRALDEVRRRLASVAETRARKLPPEPLALALVEATFGPGFRALPTFTAGKTTTDLDPAFTASGTLQGGDPRASILWLERTACVRDGAARLTDALTAAELCGTGERVELVVDQLPRVTGDRWAGMAYGEAAAAPRGRISLAVHRPRPFAGDKPAVAALVVDEWTEVIPAESQTTALALHHDRPNAAAPNAIVLAVPPDHAEWTTDRLAHTVLQAFDVARFRAVDRDALEPLGHVLPATYLALNLHGMTVSTDLVRGVGASP